MNKRAFQLIIAVILLPLGCGGDGDPTGPNAPFCSDHPDDAIPTFEDAILEERVRSALSLGSQENLTCGLISGLTVLDTTSGFTRGSGITSLAGIENLTSLVNLLLPGSGEKDTSISDISPLAWLTNLTRLILISNSITDISALSGLTRLTELSIASNSVTDISVLSGLTDLTRLTLKSNPISDISALSGLTNLTFVNLQYTDVSCTDVALLEARGLDVTSDCTNPMQSTSVSFSLSPSYRFHNACEAHDQFLRLVRERDEFEVETDKAGEPPMPFWSETIRRVMAT